MKKLLSIPYKEYEKAEGVRQSNLKHLLRSPAHYRQALSEHLDTPALAFGRALHVAILEPHLFDSNYVVAPKIDKRTSAGKAQWAELQESGRIVLSEEDVEAIEGVKKAISNHKTASKILNLCKSREVSIFWEDKETGLKCKARLDAYCEAMNAVVDLKSTKDASQFEFSKSIHNYGYHIQAAHTLAGCARIGIPAETFIFIAFEKEPPYGVAVYQIDEQSLIVGAAKVSALLHLLKSCKDSDQWPAYPDQIQKISLPAWAMKNFEEKYDGII